MFEECIQYFNGLEQQPLHRMMFLVGGLMAFWLLEGAIPLYKLHYRKTKWKHAAINFTFTGMHLVIHFFLAILIVLLSDWCGQNEFGLVYWLNAGTAGTLLISFLVLDFFGGWLVHITEHKVPFLWRFHIVHHSDTNVDVTTGLRHHPGESLLRAMFIFTGIFLSGSPMYAVMIYQTILVISTAFIHANISLPLRADKLISYVFVSPNMHKVHHHWKQPFTDSNYGAILSIWDRLLKTFKVLPAGDIKYGLDRYYPNEKDEHLTDLLKSPFTSTTGKP